MQTASQSQEIVSSVASQIPVTMNSREIAELCQKKHGHVLRDIRAYVGAVVQLERGIDVRAMDWAGKEGVQLFGDTPIGGVSCTFEVNKQNGQPYPLYHLDKTATMTVVSGYNVLLRNRIVRRWLELEGELVAIPKTLPEALRAYADEVEQHQNTKARLELSEAKSGSRPNQKSALAYAKMRNITLSNPQLARLGKLATQNGKANGREKETVTDERWGSVGIYDVRDLEAAWNFMFNSLPEGNA